jgi:hypothetical protein
MDAIEKMKGKLTETEAKALFDSKWWEDLPAKPVALAQLRQERLCIPFGEFVFIVARAMGISPDGLPDTALRNPPMLIRAIEAQG